ncbi:hypothetical protein [Neorhodopirellula lusitana]|uniref:hypothetical protein n=1 Tax=Neorhodopirellula lusitana TaxID=445327 RepID=UPI00385167F5
MKFSSARLVVFTVLATSVAATWAVPARAQGLDDLFKLPADNSFEFSDLDEPLGASNSLRDDEAGFGQEARVAQEAPVAQQFEAAQEFGAAQEYRVAQAPDRRAPRRDLDLASDADSRSMTPPAMIPRSSETVRSPSDFKLIDRPGSESVRPTMDPMEIRQARALEETRSRIARLEAARWSGAAALRPSWNPNPMTSSRYPTRRVLQVPVYIRNY